MVIWVDRSGVSWRVPEERVTLIEKSVDGLLVGIMYWLADRRFWRLAAIVRNIDRAWRNHWHPIPLNSLCPCPYCGAEKWKLAKRGWDGGSWTFWVVCGSCRRSWTGPTPEMAIHGWNTAYIWKHYYHENLPVQIVSSLRPAFSEEQ